MKLVTQTAKGECGPACLAMVLEETLTDVMLDFPDCARDGVSDAEMVEYLAKHGVAALSSVTWPCRRCVSQGDSYARVPGIATVPSLNHPGLLHFIVWDGETWLDPSPGPRCYPEDAPTIRGERTVSWSSVLLLWLPDQPIEGA